MLFKWLWFEPPDLHENSFGKFGLQTSNFWAQIPRSKLFSPWANGLVEGEATVFSHQIQICSADLRFTSGNYWEKNHTSHLTTAGLLGNIGYMLGVKVAIILVYMYAYIYMVVDQNSFIPGRPFFANKHFTFAKLSQTPPCWPTTPLMKIRSPPAKLRQRITDHFLVAF